MCFTVTPLIEYCVPLDGLLSDGSVVATHGWLLCSDPCASGAHPYAATSGHAPRHWISKVFSRTDEGLVVGYIVHFDSRVELEQFDLGSVESEIRKWLHLAKWELVAARVDAELTSAEQKANELILSAMRK